MIQGVRFVLPLVGALLWGGCGGGGGGPPAQAGTAPRIISITPAPGSAGQSPTRIEVGFDQAINPATVRSNTFRLSFSGGDGTFGDSNEVGILPVSVRLTSSTTAVLDLTGLPLPDEVYQVRLFGTGPDVVRGTNGRVLDGEFGASLPSGDRTAGGDFIVTFSTSLAVTGMTPQPGSTSPFAPAGIVVTLSANISVATIDATTFRLVRSGGDSTFQDGNEVGIDAASIALTGASQFTFDLTGAAMPSDLYQVTLAGAGAGRAVRLDGFNDVVTMPFDTAFQPASGSWTVEAWVRVEDDTLANPLIACADGDFVNGWRIAHDGAGTGSFLGLIDGTAGTRNAAGGVAPVAAAWQHVALVYDSNQGALRLYADGSLVGNDAAGTVGSVTPTADMVLGVFGSDFYKGAFDEVRLWSFARTEPQMRRDRYRKLSGNETGLVGYWNFDINPGSIVIDLSPSNNSGTLGADVDPGIDDPVRFNSTAWRRIAAQNGSFLDGRFDGTFPSGRGRPGEDFVATFRIN